MVEDSYSLPRFMGARKGSITHVAEYYFSGSKQRLLSKQASTRASETRIHLKFVPVVET